MQKSSKFEENSKINIYSLVPQIDHPVALWGGRGFLFTIVVGITFFCMFSFFVCRKKPKAQIIRITVLIMFVQNEFKKIGDFLNNTLETAAERRHAFFNHYNNNRKKIKTMK